MTTWRVNNSTSLGGEVCSPWQPNHAYGLGARCVCRVAYGTTAARAFVYEVTTAGTSHAATEPTWPTTVTNTVVDSGVTWTCRSPSDGSWDNASCYLPYILGYTTVAAGDSIYVDDGHSESSDHGNNFLIKGSANFALPIKVFCVNKADNSPSTGAIVCNAASSSYLWFQGFLYSYGVNYRCSTYQISMKATGTVIILEGANTTVLEVCGSNGMISYGNNSSLQVFKILSGNIAFGHANNYIYIGGGLQLFQWHGGALTGVAPGVLFNGSSGTTRNIFIEDVDLSNLGNHLIADAGDINRENTFLLRCKMPAAYTPNSGAWLGCQMGKFRMHHCSSENISYSLYENSYEGSTQHETTIVRAGGASDGTTPISVKMISSANTVDNINGLESPEIHAWTNSTTEKTFTIELVHDSAAALQNDEIWMELDYPVNSTDGLGAVARSKCVPLGTPEDIPDSSETWTTTGLTNPNTRKLSVAVTPGKSGPITAKVYLAKASTTVYIDPIITES